MAIAGLALADSARAEGPKFSFDIPAGDALKTLRQYYAQSKIEMLYLTDKVRGAQTNAITGHLDATEALSGMLKGTTLDYSFDEDFSFVSINPREAEGGGQGTAEPVEVRTVVAQTNANQLTERVRSTFGSEQKLEEVVVTGSWIRGVVDIMSPLEFVTRREMNKTGYATVQDALQALPVNIGGAPSEDFTGTGNFARGVAANLRGLGAGATLVLVNGHRQPYSGTDGDFVDISNIPWSAVERIEVLPDGASALYGSDAIAGVINIIMQSDFEGIEAQARIGSAKGGADEKLGSLLAGRAWRTGHALFSYQFTERGRLPAWSRFYTANADKTALGGSDYRTHFSAPGNILDPRTFAPAFAIPYRQGESPLTVADLLPGQVNLQNRYADIDLVPEKRIQSLYVSTNQELGADSELFAEARLGERRVRQQYFSYQFPLFVPSTNAFFINPFAGPPFVVVGYDFLNDFGPLDIAADNSSFSGTAGLKTKVGDSWQWKMSGSFGRDTTRYEGNNVADPVALAAALADSDPATAFNPFGSGGQTNPATIEAIRIAQREYAKSKVTAANLTGDGTVIRTPKGPIKLAVGAEFRREALERGGINVSSFDRSVESSYAELSIPLVGHPDDARAVPRLELSLAGRHERYSDFGTTSNPKIGLRWVPTESLKLRSSWGTSFKAPKLVDIYDSSRNSAGMASLRDPKSATGFSTVIVREGNNPRLQEETATTWTAGIDLVPRWLKGTTVSLTYYSIDYDKRIVVPGPSSPFAVLEQESVWGEIIARNPAQSLIDEICDSPEFLTSSAQCKAAQVAAIVDLRVRNLASTQVRGIDLKFDQVLDTRHGEFSFGLYGGYMLDFAQAVSESSPATDVVNTVGNPPALRLRARADWYQRGWNLPGFGVNLTVGHNGAYRDDENPVWSRIDSLTTVDLRLAYRTQRGSGLLNDVEIGLNAVNLFGTAPPFVDRESGYDEVNSDPFGRVVSFSLQKRW